MQYFPYFITYFYLKYLFLIRLIIPIHRHAFRSRTDFRNHRSTFINSVHPCVYFVQAIQGLRMRVSIRISCRTWYNRRLWHNTLQECFTCWIFGAMMRRLKKGQRVHSAGLDSARNQLFSIRCHIPREQDWVFPYLKRSTTELSFDDSIPYKYLHSFSDVRLHSPKSYTVPSVSIITRRLPSFSI